MFGRKIATILMMLVFMGCAKPNYQDPVAIKGSVPNQEKPDDSNDFHLVMQKLELSLRMKWEIAPTDQKSGSLILNFSYLDRPEQSANEDLSPKVILWMPSMGHGSSSVKVQKMSEGRYRAYNVFFIMPGDWEIKVQIKNSLGILDEAVQKITL